MKKKTLYLVDVSNMFFRAFYAIRTLSNSKGMPTNAIYGFISMTIKLLRDSKPDYIAYCYDLPGGSFRKDIDPNYKANRSETPEELKPQIPYIKVIAELMGIPCFEKENFEADDVIGSLSHYGKNNDFDVVIVSGDKDFAQLVGKDVRLFDPMKEKMFDSDGVIEKWGVSPEKFIDYLAIVGDSSDNIPGVRGLGPKGAQKLLADYSGLTEIYQNIDKVAGKSAKNKLIESKDNAFLSYRLATIVQDLDLVKNKEDLKKQAPNKDELIKLLDEFEFKTFKRTLFENFSTSSSGTNTADTDTSAKITKLKLPTRNITLTELSFEDLATKISTDDSLWILKHEDSLALAQKDNVFKIPQETSLLVKFLSSESFEFKGYDLKSIFTDISFCGEVAWDQMLAAYVIKAGNIKSLEQVCENYLDMPLDKEVSLEQLYNTHLDLELILRADLEEKKLDQILETIELPLIETLYSMEKNGICIDVDFLKDYSQSLEKDIAVVTKEIHDIAGEEFNISSPKQLAVILFEKLDLPKGKKTKTGYSTNTDVLEKLLDVHPIAQKILNYRELTKLKSTYVDAIPELTKENNRVHSILNQALTSTGRLSSTQPNLQNIPIRTERGRRVRKAFIAPKNKVILSADYSQIELRVLAHIANDEQLISAFKKDQDIHSKTASEVFGIDIKDVSPEQRRKAKAVNFGIAYGQGAYGLAETLKISRGEAKEIITKYFERFSGIKTYMEQVVITAKEKGFVETLIGRRRYLPELNATNHIQRAFGERAAVNAPIQGTASDIVKMAMLELQMDYEKTMILQIHDELLFELDEKTVAEDAKKIQYSMENCIHLKVPLKVNLAWGKNWDEAH